MLIGLQIKRSFSSVTLLEGDSVTLTCTPSLDVIVVLWTHGSSNISQREDITYDTPILKHSLTIASTRLNDSGNYSCRVAIDDTNIKTFVIVKVIRGMKLISSILVYTDIFSALLSTQATIRLLTVCTWYYCNTHLVSQFHNHACIDQNM